jgi:hypothetical protein
MGALTQQPRAIRCCYQGSSLSHPAVTACMQGPPLPGVGGEEQFRRVQRQLLTDVSSARGRNKDGFVRDQLRRNMVGGGGGAPYRTVCFCKKCLVCEGQTGAQPSGRQRCAWGKMCCRLHSVWGGGVCIIAFTYASALIRVGQLQSVHASQTWIREARGAVYPLLSMV